jgi:dsDNA-specific endonuclease/ATPase MutS2
MADHLQGNPVTDKYDGVLKELAALLVPHLIEQLNDEINIRVQSKIDDLTTLDKNTIREVCEEVIDASDIDDKINDWFNNSFDISDHQSEIVDMVEEHIDDRISAYLDAHLDRRIETHVRSLTFTVEVS